MVATRSARFSRCVLRCQGSRSPSTALMLRAACSIPPIQTPNPSKNGPSSSRYPTVNHFRPKPIGGEGARVEPGREHLAVHAGELDLQPDLRLLQRHPRPLLRGVEQAHRSALAHHVHRTARLGSPVLINGTWY